MSQGGIGDSKNSKNPVSWLKNWSRTSGARCALVMVIGGFLIFLSSLNRDLRLPLSGAKTAVSDVKTSPND